jgi:predicted GIY-YIG superfamily endonuclease
MPSGSKWYLYIIRCSDGTLYTRIARDIAARLRAHAAGRGARYTRGRGPFELCAKRQCADKSAALSLEYAVKRLSRADKLRLVAPRALARFARKHAEVRG